MSLFGSTATQPQASLFGNNTGNQQQSQPAQGSSLFGGGNLGQQGQQQQPQGANLFGSGIGQPLQQQQTQQPAGGSIFGGFGQNQQQPSNQQQAGGSSSFFSHPPAQQQQQQQTAPSTTNPLFGGSTTQPQQSGGGFGGFGSNATNTTTTSNGLFGQPISGFGNAQSIQRQPTMSAFGAGATNTNPLFKQSSQQTNLAATSQPTNAPVFTKSTKFNDLPDQVKRALEGIDSFIQGRVQISNELKHRKLGDEATKSQDLIRNAHKDLVNVISDLQSDVHHTRALKAKTDQTVQDTIVATRIVDGFRNPQPHGVYLKNHASFPLEFFQRVTDEMRDRLRWYKSTIEQIERKLASAAIHQQATPQAIVSTLEAQHATFMALASRTAAVDADLQKIKMLYTQLWRAKTGSMRDPFNDLDRGTGDFGLEGLSGK